MRRVIQASENIKKWAVTVSWAETGDVVVEAESAEAALEYVQNHLDEFDLPSESYYLEDSFDVFDEDPDWVAEVKEK